MTEKQIITAVARRLARRARQRLSARVTAKKTASAYRIKRAMFALSECPENVQIHL